MDELERLRALEARVQEALDYLAVYPEGSGNVERILTGPRCTCGDPGDGTYWEHSRSCRAVR
jgi:hypothetical protein